MSRKNNGSRHFGSAFTLIELLVVIAIIAILAAILFPVFAQAKMAAKKTAAISQAKQVGTAIVMYSNDYDDLAPCGSVPDLSNPAVVQYHYNDDTMQNPAGWFNYPVAQDEYALCWNNTIQPYIKSYQLLNISGMEQLNVANVGSVGATWAAGYANPIQSPVPCNLTYNGFMQYYSMSAIANVSKFPLVWQGEGNKEVNGAAMTNPRLRCTGTGPCLYNSGGMPQPDASGGGMYTISLAARTDQGPNYNPFGVNVIVRGDTSTKPHKFSSNHLNYPQSINDIDVFRDIDQDGYIPSDPIYIRGQYRNGILFLAPLVPDNTYAN